MAADGVTPIEFAEHNCFACGSLNTHGLRMTIHIEPERAWSEVRLADRFEGWDGVAHGGVLAALMDEVMGWSLADSDNWGVTARLNVDYHRPVEIGTALRVEGWVTRSRRRVIDTAARIVGQETGIEYATATATYVAVDEQRKRALQERYGIRRMPRPNTPELVAR